MDANQLSGGILVRAGLKWSHRPCTVRKTYLERKRIHNTSSDLHVRALSVSLSDKSFAHKYQDFMKNHPVGEERNRL